MKRLLITLCVTMFFVPASQAGIRITEWMYSGAGDEFIEFTNVSASVINMTDWSFDDSSREPGSVDLSAFGDVAPGESVLLVEATAEAFRADWGLAPTVKIIGELAHNLGRNDEINLYNALDDLVDRLTYGDQDIPGTIRTLNVSGNPISPSVLGTNDVSGWVLSSVGDAYGSYASAGGDLGTPVHDFAERTTAVMLFAILVEVCLVRRRLVGVFPVG